MDNTEKLLKDVRDKIIELHEVGLGEKTFKGKTLLNI